MKQPLVFKILLAGIAVFLFQACATAGPTTGMAALTGTWTNSLGTVWTMRADGSFDVDLNKDGKRDAWGTCSVEGNTVRIIGTGGVVPKGCANTTGSYHFTRTTDTLHFTFDQRSLQRAGEEVTL